MFEATIAGLVAGGLACEKTRIGLEKPLGTDLRSSCHINDAVAKAFPEERIFRIDHYLGKETVQNLLAHASPTSCSSRCGMPHMHYSGRLLFGNNSP